MDEASGCLMRSISQPSPISCEYKEGDPLRALTTSISFGRFMKEPLDWEKWSSFTHNRNLEEVEKFSKPGYVAAKKAYFEAHYKKIAAKKKAEVSLEQENEAPNRSPEPNYTNEVLYNSSMDSELANKQQNGAHTSPEHKSTNEILHDSSMDSNSAKSDSLEIPRLGIELVCPVHSNGSDLNVEANEHTTMEREQSHAVTEEVVLSENHIQVDMNVEANEYGAEPSLAVPEEVVLSESPIQVELSNQLGNFEKHSGITAIQEEKTPFKDATNRGNKVLSTKKKLAIPPPKSSVNNGAPKLPSPVKSSIPVHPRKKDTTSNNKKAIKDLMERKRLTPQSLHMSINFGSPAHETTKRSSPVLKIGNSNISKTLVKEKRTKRAAATRASVNGEVAKHSLVLPRQENKRPRTPLDRLVRESRTVVGKSQSLSISHSESLGACAKKPRPPTVSSSFVLRSEERAAKRKEFFQKLEDKVNNTETVSIPRQTKAKIPPTRPHSPNLGSKPSPSTIQDTCSRPPRGSTFMRTGLIKNFIERNKQNLTRSVTSLPKKKMGENASPNIQL